MKNSNAAYVDITLSADERAGDLISIMTFWEKASGMLHQDGPVERLRIREYNRGLNACIWKVQKYLKH